MEQKTASGTILMTAEQLASEEPHLPERATFRVQDTPTAKPTTDKLRTEGMVLAAVVPISMTRGR